MIAPIIVALNGNKIHRPECRYNASYPEVSLMRIRMYVSKVVACKVCKPLGSRSD